MKVSIITVVFNNNLTIRDTINSILNQTHNDIEYIIVDGGSTDGTLEIINEFKDRISVVISEADMGIYDAMNKGLKIASGEIVGILNSDDIYFNNSIISFFSVKVKLTRRCVGVISLTRGEYLFRSILRQTRYSSCLYIHYKIRRFYPSDHM